jgi:hypothetical protein
MLTKTFVSIAIAAGLYVALVAFPSPLFAYRTSLDNITVFSDDPIPPAVNGVLADAQRRLRTSPWNDPALAQRIFLCNRNWRFLLFANTDYGAGGVTKTWLNRNIFLRRSNIERDRLIGRSGRETPGERTLAYFLAHEMTHALEVHRLGRLAYLRLPVWKREGYADYVARDPDGNFCGRLAAFRRGEREMDPRRSGLYLRYLLFVSFLLDREHTSVDAVLAQPVDEAALDRRLRDDSRICAP